MLSACQADLFEDMGRWPRKPYCTDDLASGLRIRSLRQAIHRVYIQANPPHLRVWIVLDLDYPCAALAWETANLAPPSFTTVNRENGHAHVVYGLKVPVLVDSRDMRQGPMRYLCAVESMLIKLLRADPGYSGLITKNPAHPLWKTLVGPCPGYELGELGEYLPGLEKHIPRQRKPDEVGLGRNVTIFEWLRQYAYRNIRHYKGEVRNFVYWQSHLNGKALERNGDLLYPLDGREVWHICKSVSKWTWRQFDLAASDARFSELQAHRGRMGGVASGISRAAANEDKRASARLMAAQGLTIRDIAETLGMGKSTVGDWLSGEAVIR